MRDFINISTTGDYTKLVLSGNPSPEQTAAAWEAIVQRNAKENGDRTYDSYFQLLKSYTLLVASYTVIRASLVGLSYIIDYEVVEDLRRRGYKISLDSTEALAKSITLALKKVSNLVTKAAMKQKEIESLITLTSSASASGFEQLMASLTNGLGFVVQDDITLARYNEYKKLLKAKAQARRKDGK